MHNRRTRKPFTCTHFGWIRAPAATVSLARWSPPRWTGHRQARIVTLRVAVDNTVARSVYESLGFLAVTGEGVNARDEVAMSLIVR